MAQRQLGALAAAGAATLWAARWLMRRRRRPTRDAYLILDPSVDVAATPGAKLVIIQRHGRTRKNVVLKVEKDRLKASLRASLESGGTREGNRAIFEEWASWCTQERWFDDCVDDVGLRQAFEAGRELGAWVRRSGVAVPQLCVVSPFRRAHQTQAAGFRSAAFETAAVLGERTAASTSWVARDDLRETPYAEASCQRHASSVLARWAPSLDGSCLAPNTASSSVTALAGALGDGANLRPELDADAATFLAWLRRRPETVVWVTTHQGPAAALLAAIFPGHAEARGYRRDLKNAQCVVLRLAPTPS